MKFPKPFMLFDSDNTFIEKIVSEYYKFGSKKIIIVLNGDLGRAPWKKYLTNVSLNATIIFNNSSELGRYYSIKLGVSALGNSDFCFLQNIDNPFVDQKLLRKIYSSKINNGYVVPIYRGKGGHPILLANVIIESIVKEKKLNMNLKEKLKEFNRKTISIENKKILANINTLEDYKSHFDIEFLRKNYVELKK
jgi:molybdenum cofactor cytidylyltransferase